jgi:hypothetical protein
MAERNLMAVRTELVQETMVARLVELVRAEPGAGPQSLRSFADWDPELATAGYKLRRVERRLFEPARRPVPELVRRLTESAGGRAADHDAVARVAHDLASREPLGRPEPDDENAATWRVPGPGGHVRHYVATELIGNRGRELKRAVVYGFLVGCCEEALERQTGDDLQPRRSRP